MRRRHTAVGGPGTHPSGRRDRDDNLDHWEKWLGSGERRTRRCGTVGTGPPTRNRRSGTTLAPARAPPAVRNPSKVNGYYRGPLPDGVSLDRMSRWRARATRRWRRTGRARCRIRKCARHDAELAAHRAMRAKWRAQGGRARRGRRAALPRPQGRPRRADAKHGRRVDKKRPDDVVRSPSCRAGPARAQRAVGGHREGGGRRGACLLLWIEMTEPTCSRRPSRWTSQPGVCPSDVELDHEDKG